MKVNDLFEGSAQDVHVSKGVEEPPPRAGQVRNILSQPVGTFPPSANPTKVQLVAPVKLKVKYAKHIMFKGWGCVFS